MIKDHFSVASDYSDLYHDAWVDERYRHSIYSPYILGCMVARTTNALAVASDPQLSGKHWLIESWYKSAVPWVSVGVWVCTLRVVICITGSYKQLTREDRGPGDPSTYSL